jgi:hypothetical protein
MNGTRPWCNSPYATSQSHSDTPHSVGLLWTSDQPSSENFTWQHLTLTTERHSCPGRDSDPQFQQLSGRKPTDGTATGTELETYYHINDDQPLDPTKANWIKFTILNPTCLKCSAIFSSHLHLRPPSCFGANAFCEWICMCNTSYACLPCMLHIPHFQFFSSFAYKLGSDSSDVTSEQNKIWSIV